MARERQDVAFRATGIAAGRPRSRRRFERGLGAVRLTATLQRARWSRVNRRVAGPRSLNVWRSCTLRLFATFALRIASAMRIGPCGRAHLGTARSPTQNDFRLYHWAIRGRRRSHEPEANARFRVFRPRARAAITSEPRPPETLGAGASRYRRRRGELPVEPLRAPHQQRLDDDPGTGVCERARAHPGGERAQGPEILLEGGAGAWIREEPADAGSARRMGINEGFAYMHAWAGCTAPAC